MPLSLNDFAVSVEKWYSEFAPELVRDPEKHLISLALSRIQEVMQAKVINSLEVIPEELALTPDGCKVRPGSQYDWYRVTDTASILLRYPRDMLLEKIFEALQQIIPMKLQ